MDYLYSAVSQRSASSADGAAIAYMRPARVAIPKPGREQRGVSGHIRVVWWR